MTDRYPYVFQPIRIGPVEVRNRFYMPPHGLRLVTGGAHGAAIPTDDYVAYYEERAAGGVGLIMTALSTFPRDGRACPLYEESVPHFRAVADAVHARGAKIFGQLSYYWGHSVPWEPMGAMAPVLGPSGYQRFEMHDTVHRMTVDEIRRWIAFHADCARHLKAAGYDGIQIHSAHGMLLEQFLSPYFNHREDEYGGDLDGRMRALVEAITVVRDEVGPTLAVGIRFNCDEMLPGGLTQDDTRIVLDRLVEMGLIEFADLDIAVEPQQGPFMTAPTYIEPLFNSSFVESVGSVARDRIVVMAAAGRVTSVAQAEQLIAAGVMHMVGAARGLIAEPELVKNALEGREDRSRQCIACNFCIASGYLHRGQWGCTINPATGRERRWGAGTFANRAPCKKVVVVGGGPAGLEAARGARLLGHDVVLFEAAPQLGGQLALWATLPGREILQSTIAWYEARLRETGVDVRTSSPASAEAVLAERPDAVMVATGARYARDGESGFLAAPIPGWDRDFVHTPEDVIRGDLRPGGRVILLDEEGINTGVGIAELLAGAGAAVEIVTRAFSVIGSDLYYNMDFAFIIPRLKRLGVRTTLTTFVKSIEPGRVTVFDILTNDEEVREVDAVVLATMRRSVDELATELRGRVDQLFTIGDALAPRLLFDATYEGQRFARLVGDPAAPRDTGEALFTPSPPSFFPRPAAEPFEGTRSAG